MREEGGVKSLDAAKVAAIVEKTGKTLDIS
jgi:hypothetical protein